MITFYEFTTARSVQEVFDVLAAVDAYKDWLPPSKTYLRTAWKDDGPIQVGSTYVDHQTDGTMTGEVHLLKGPNEIGFRQVRKMPLGARIEVTIEWTITARDGGTHVRRRHEMKMPALLRVALLFIKSGIIAENQRIADSLEKQLAGTSP